MSILCRLGDDSRGWYSVSTDAPTFHPNLSTHGRRRERGIIRQAFTRLLGTCVHVIIQLDPMLALDAPYTHQTQNPTSTE